MYGTSGFIIVIEIEIHLASKKNRTDVYDTSGFKIEMVFDGNVTYQNHNRKQVINTLVQFIDQQQDNRTQERASINAYGLNQQQTWLPPASNGPPPDRPGGYQQRKPIDNRPAWVARTGYDVDKPTEKRQVEFAMDETTKKNGRLFVTLGSVLGSTLGAKGAPMPLDVDNGLPGIKMRFGKTEDTKVTLICNVDTCAAMSTGNLQLHEWIMTTYPEIVAEYIQYVDNKPFEPIQLSCAVQDLDTVQAEHGKLTAIVRYWT